MRLVFRLITICAIGFIGYSLYTAVPIFRGYLTCFDRNIEDFDSIEVATRSVGWSEESRCQKRRMTIDQYETCIRDVDEASEASGSLKSYAYELARIFRPATRDPETMKREHDNLCSEYPQTLYEPPEWFKKL